MFVGAGAACGIPSIFSVLLGKDTPPTDYRSYAEFAAELFGLLGGALIEGVVLVDDDPRKPWFMSYGHTPAVIGETLNIIEDAAKAIFGGRLVSTRS